MFNKFWKKRREEHPDEPRYVSLCHLIEGSGEDEDKIEMYFDRYMELEEDYDYSGRDTMLDYLVIISKDWND
jgi:hypothetical protein